MNSNIYDRKKHSYKNRPYYCPINNMWFYPYMYMNPYTSYMVNPFMTQYMDPYINSHMTNPSCHGNMCSCNDRSQCEATGAYDENNYNFTKENIYTNQYEEEEKRISYQEDSLDSMVTFNQEDRNEHNEKEEKLDKEQQNNFDSGLESTFMEKKDIQLEKVNKGEEIAESKEKELCRSVKINMRKVPLKEITD